MKETFTGLFRIFSKYLNYGTFSISDNNGIETYCKRAWNKTEDRFVYKFCS